MRSRTTHPSSTFPCIGAAPTIDTHAVVLSRSSSPRACVRACVSVCSCVSGAYFSLSACARPSVRLSVRLMSSGTRVPRLPAHGRYEKGLFFPSTEEVGGIDRSGAAHVVGRGRGEGTTVNVAWNTRGHARPGDSEYLAAWEELLMPIAREYDPEVASSPTTLLP